MFGKSRGHCNIKKQPILSMGTGINALISNTVLILIKCFPFPFWYGTIAHRKYRYYFLPQSNKSPCFITLISHYHGLYMVQSQPMSVFLCSLHCSSSHNCQFLHNIQFIHSSTFSWFGGFCIL